MCTHMTVLPPRGNILPWQRIPTCSIDLQLETPQHPTWICLRGHVPDSIIGASTNGKNNFSNSRMIQQTSSSIKNMSAPTWFQKHL